MKYASYKKVFSYSSCLMVIYDKWVLPHINYTPKSYFVCTCAPSENSEYSHLSHVCYYAANSSFCDISNEISLVVFTFLKTHRVIWLYANSIVTKPNKWKKIQNVFQAAMVRKKTIRSCVLIKKILLYWNFFTEAFIILIRPDPWYLYVHV